jgi:hypothetical protein
VVVPSKTLCRCVPLVALALGASSGHALQLAQHAAQSTPRWTMPPHSAAFRCLYSTSPDAGRLQAPATVRMTARTRSSTTRNSERDQAMLASWGPGGVEKGLVDAAARPSQAFQENSTREVQLLENKQGSAQPPHQRASSWRLAAAH